MKILYWNVKSRNAGSLGQVRAALSVGINRWDIAILAEITSRGVGVRPTVERWNFLGTRARGTVNHVGGTTYFGNGESIVVVTKGQRITPPTRVLLSPNADSRLAVKFAVRNIHVVGFHCAAVNQAMRRSEHLGLFRLLTSGRVNVAIGDWNSEPRDLGITGRHRGSLQVCAARLPTCGGRKYDYAITSRVVGVRATTLPGTQGVSDHRAVIVTVH